ncbi:MAG: hypothetical protein D3914_02245 [Candidatus Electrothrix sp. LOE2]|nr:hypothetical protein [Candidatus Electrothrix sp. LOE2]
MISCTHSFSIGHKEEKFSLEENVRYVFFPVCIIFRYQPVMLRLLFSVPPLETSCGVNITLDTGIILNYIKKIIITNSR